MPLPSPRPTVSAPGAASKVWSGRFNPVSTHASLVRQSGGCETRPDLSVVVPTRNRCQLLASALKSLVEQEADSVSYEVVVVDNSSQDGTRSVVESFMGKDHPLVRYVREGRPGISYARNAGICAARSSVIAFLDDDCRAGPRWATTIKQTFDSNATLGCIGGKVLPVWPFEPPTWLDRRHWSPLAITDHGDSTIAVDAHHPLCLVAANLAVRRDVFRHVGLFSSRLTRSEDHELELRFFRAGGRAQYVPTMVVTTEVPAARCTKRYHRRWHAQHGRDCATIGLSECIGRHGEVLSHPVVARTLFGVPLFLYRELLAEITAWLSAACGQASVRFHHEVRVIHLVHYMRQRGVAWSSGHRSFELDEVEHVQRR
jgi:hypothetical protein